MGRTQKLWERRGWRLSLAIPTLPSTRNLHDRSRRTPSWMGSHLRIDCCRRARRLSRLLFPPLLRNRKLNAHRSDLPSESPPFLSRPGSKRLSYFVSRLATHSKSGTQRVYQPSTRVIFRTSLPGLESVPRRVNCIDFGRKSFSLRLCLP
jgi:hypothetical protein